MAGVSDLTTTVAPLTHRRWQLERKQISSFIFGLFDSQKFLHESSYDEYTLLKQKTGASTDFISNIKNVRIIIIIIIIITMIIIIVMMRMITKLVSTKN